MNFNPILTGVLVTLALCATAVATYVTRDLKLDRRDDPNGNFTFAVRMLTPIAGVLYLALFINALTGMMVETETTSLVLAMVLMGFAAAAAGMTSIAFFINFERPLLGMLYAVMACAFFGSLCYPVATFAMLHGYVRGYEAATYLAVIAMALATGIAASLVTKLVQVDKRQRQNV